MRSMLMDVRRILIRPTFTSKPVYNCSRASSRARPSRTTPRLRNRRMFTPRLTRRLVLVLHPLLSGELLFPPVQRCRAPLLLVRSRTGTVASMSCRRRARDRPLTVLTSARLFELPVDPRKPALIKSLAGFSPTLLAVEFLSARPRWAVQVVTLLLTLCLSWQTLPPQVIHAPLVVALAEGDLCPPRLLAPRLLVVLTVARLVLAVLHLTTAHSHLPARFVPFVTSVPRPQSPRILISSSIPAPALRHRLVMRLASLPARLRPLLRPLPPRLLHVSVARIVLPLR